MCGMNGQTTNNDMYAWTAGLDGGRKVLGVARLDSAHGHGSARLGTRPLHGAGKRPLKNSKRKIWPHTEKKI